MTRRGFTLIELLVVIAIIAVLMGMLLPAIQRVRESAMLIKCENQVKQVVLAAHHFADDHNSKLPSLYPVNEGTGPSWFRDICPYLGELWIAEFGDKSTLYKGINCPSDFSAPTGRCQHGYAVVSYAPNFQMFGTGPGFTATYRINNIPDGTSQVLFVGERFALMGLEAENDWTNSMSMYGTQFAWVSMEPPQVRISVPESDWTRPNSGHVYGMVAGLGDGSVRIVSKYISQPTWWNACVPDDGNVLANDWLNN